MNSRGLDWRAVLTIAAAALVGAFCVYLVAFWNPTPDVSEARQAPAASTPTPTVKEDATVAVIGDSYSDGSWPALVDAEDDTLRLRAYVEGGTGYVTTTLRGSEPFGDRLDEALSADPDILLVVGSRNDATEPTPAVRRAAAALYRNAQEAKPDLTIIAVGPIWDWSQPPPGASAAAQAVAEAADGEGVAFVDGLGWFADRPDLIGRDDIHPNEKGQAVLADRISQVLSDFLAD